MNVCQFIKPNTGTRPEIIEIEDQEKVLAAIESDERVKTVDSIQGTVEQRGFSVNVTDVWGETVDGPFRTILKEPYRSAATRKVKASFSHFVLLVAFIVFFNNQVEHPNWSTYLINATNYLAVIGQAALLVFHVYTRHINLQEMEMTGFAAG